MCAFKVEREEVRGCTCEQRVFDSRCGGFENAKVISSLEEGVSYKFLGVLETETRRQNCSSKCSEVVLAKVIYYLV